MNYPKPVGTAERAFLMRFGLTHAAELCSQARTSLALLRFVVTHLELTLTARMLFSFLNMVFAVDS